MSITYNFFIYKTLKRIQYTVYKFIKDLRTTPFVIIAFQLNIYCVKYPYFNFAILLKQCFCFNFRWQILRLLTTEIEIVFKKSDKNFLPLKKQYYAIWEISHRGFHEIIMVCSRGISRTKYKRSIPQITWGLPPQVRNKRFNMRFAIFTFVLAFALVS